MFSFPSPTTILTVGALMAVAAISALGTSMTYEKFIIPSREESAAEAATAMTLTRMTAASQAAAEAARAAAAVKLRQQYEAAIDGYIADLTASNAALDAAIKRQAEKDAEYGNQLSENGKMCDLDSNDIDYIIGVQPNSSGE